jgi:hypothetical protein
MVTRFFTSYTGTAPTNADLTTFNASISTAFGTNLKSLLNSGSLLQKIDSIDLSSSSAALAENIVSVAGTRGAAVLPAATSLVASYHIARRYRGGHCRGYWPFGIQTDLAQQTVWSGAFVTACNTGLAAFFTAVNAAGWAAAGTLTHVNVSYFNGFSVVTNPVTHRARNVPTLRGTPVVDPVVAVQAQQSIGSQRRRNEFVG